MAKTVIAIKLRSMWNNATKPLWKLILIIIMALYFGVLAALVAFGGIATAASGEIDLFSKGAILGSLGVTVAWIVFPLLGMGLEGSLQPRSFAPFVAPSKKLSRALLAATPVGPGGLMTVLAMLVGSIGLIVGGKILLALVSVVLIPASVLAYALMSRTLTSYVSAKTMRTQKSRDLTQIIVTIVFLVVLFSLSFGISAAAEYANGNWIDATLALTKWTPLVGAFAIPFLILTGDVLPAILQVIYAVAIVLVLLNIWHAMVVKAMIGVKTPITPQIQQALDDRRAVVDPTIVQDREGAKAASIDKELPTLKLWTKLGLNAPTAAIAARTFRDWLKDSRLVPTTAISLLMPVLAIVVSLLDLESMQYMGLMFVFLVPLTLGTTVGMLISYDSTALSTQILAGVSGRTDRFGRSIGSQPMMIVVSIVNGAVLAWLVDFKYSVFLAIAVIYALTLIVMSIMAAMTGYRTFGVQPPGVSSMSTKGTANQFLLFLVMFLVLALAPMLFSPILFAIYAAGGTALADTLIGIAAIVWAVAIHIGLLLLGAFLYERNQAQILAQIRSWPGH